MSVFYGPQSQNLPVPSVLQVTPPLPPNSTEPLSYVWGAFLLTREHRLGATGDAPVFVGRAVPIYFIGDSHTLVHNHLLYTKNGTHYITESHYVHGLYAREFCVDGKIAESVTAPLAGLLALTDDGWRLRWKDVTLVVQCGDLDARRTAIDLGAEAGLVLPFAPQERVSGTRPVPYALVENQARKSLEPLFLGLEQLRDMGFERLAVAAIPPPMHEDEWRRHQKPGPSEALRYAVVRTYNHVLRELAAAHNVRFLDYWPLVTVDGRREPRFDLDGVHLNLEAAALLTALVLE